MISCRVVHQAPLALAVALLSILIGLPAHAQLSPDVERILGWLPVDTETVIVSQRAFEVPDLKEGAARNYSAEEEIPIMPMMLLLGAKEGELHRRLAGSTVSLAIEGSRRYRAPRSLGLMPFEGCQILQFSADSVDRVDDAYSYCLEIADATVDLDGVEVAVFVERAEEDYWTFFVARPEPQLLLFAPDGYYLKQCLDRRRAGGEGRALPAGLPEWDHADIHADVWAVRHYRPEGIFSDPSSPFGPKKSANVPDAEAIGFVFWWSGGNENVARARYLSGSANALELMQRPWNQPREGLTPELSELAPGVVEITVAVGDPEVGSTFQYFLLPWLGHGIYL